MLARQPLRNRAHLRLRLRERAARREPAVHRQVVRRAVTRRLLVERERRPQLGAHRKIESRRHDADDDRLIAVGAHGASDDRRIRAETPPPQAVAEHDALRVRGHLFVGAERAPDRRVRVERVEERGGDEEAEDALRLVAAHQVRVPPERRRQMLDRAALELAPPVEKIGARHGFAAADPLRRRRQRHDDAIDVVHVVGMHQQRVDDAEDGGVGADGERERHHDGGRQHRTLRERPHHKAEVHGQTIHRRPSTDGWQVDPAQTCRPPTI